MSNVGIDYPVMLQRALDGDKVAIRLLIWAGGNVRLDGAATEGYSYSMVLAAKEIGERMGRSENAVHLLLGRALKKLASELEL